MFLEKYSFDNSIIGLSNNKLIYDRSRMVKEMANDLLQSKDADDYDDAITQAEEWISYNTERALPYLGDNAPIIMDINIKYIKENY